MIVRLPFLLVLAMMCVAAYHAFPIARESFDALGRGAVSAWHWLRTAR